MSIINKMLNDLSKRKNSDKESLESLTPVSTSQRFSSDAIKTTLSIVMPIVLFGLLFWVFWPEKTKAVQVQAAKNINKQYVAPGDSIESEPVLVTDVTVKEKGNKTEVDIDFGKKVKRADVHYQARTNASKTHLVLKLNQAEFYKKLKALATHGHAISIVKVDHEKNQLIFDIHLNPNVKIHKLRFSKREPLRLILELDAQKAVQIPSAHKIVEKKITEAAMQNNSGASAPLPKSASEKSNKLVDSSDHNEMIGSEKDEWSDLFEEGSGLATSLKKKATPAAEKVKKVEKFEIKEDPLTNEETLKQDYQKAVDQLSEDSSKAMEGLKIILKKVPAFQPARETIVVNLINKHDYTSAARYLNRGLAITPNYVPFIKLKARILIKEGNNAAALSVLETASPSISEDAEFYALIAALQYRTGNTDGAVRTYEKLIRYDTSASIWWMGLGIALEESKHTHSAFQAYKQALHTGNLSMRLQNYVNDRMKIIKG